MGKGYERGIMAKQTKRQIIRKTLLIISFLLFPLTIYYLSPYVIIHAIAEGIMAGSFVVFIAMAVGSIFFGRIFCGWVCPAGGLQEIVMIANNKRNKGKWRKWIKYLIWAPWVGIIAALGIKAGGIKEVDFLYQTWNGISISEPKGYIIYYVVLVIILLFALIGGRRSFCHSVCWMAPFMQLGILLRKVLHIPGLKLTAESENCISCKQCSAKCVMSLDVMEMVKTGKVESLDCTLCGECIDTCPKKVIHFGFDNK
jgi:polyferredoxin